MSEPESERRREQQRNYVKHRYEERPEVHDQDKERLRRYIKERRKDPAYREMENIKRRERRRKLREQQSQKKGGTTKAQKPSNRPSKTPVKDVTESPSKPLLRSTRYSKALPSCVPLCMEAISVDSQSTANEITTSSVYEIELDPSDCSSLEINSSYNIPSPADNSTAKTPNSAARSTTLSRFETSDLLVEAPPLCVCSSSNALRKLAKISRVMPPSDRQQFESGLLHFADDFMNSELQDPFLTLICAKLKGVPADLRPDLEVSVLRAINDTLKRK